ncbi:MAG: hypothetical protein KatS3mg120_0775 [Erythrobacter sp.]|nr:MAG: hypothetical protein KatS3mg120_0775 [Erythrobacter sp.]
MPITRHMLTIPATGRRVHYRRCGKGPPLLMVHQSPRSSGEYEPLMQAWGAHFTCIAPDTPGFGQSDPLPGAPEIGDFAAALREFMDAAGTQGLPGLWLSFGRDHPRDRAQAGAFALQRAGDRRLCDLERARRCAASARPISPRSSPAPMASTWCGCGTGCSSNPGSSRGSIAATKRACRSPRRSGAGASGGDGNARCRRCLSRRLWRGAARAARHPPARGQHAARADQRLCRRSAAGAYRPARPHACHLAGARSSPPRPSIRRQALPSCASTPARLPPPALVEDPKKAGSRSMTPSSTGAARGARANWCCTRPRANWHEPGPGQVAIDVPGHGLSDNCAAPGEAIAAAQAALWCRRDPLARASRGRSRSALSRSFARPLRQLISCAPGRAARAEAIFAPWYVAGADHARPIADGALDPEAIARRARARLRAGAAARAWHDHLATIQGAS